MRRALWRSSISSSSSRADATRGGYISTIRLRCDVRSTGVRPSRVYFKDFLGSATLPSLPYPPLPSPPLPFFPFHPLSFRPLPPLLSPPFRSRPLNPFSADPEYTRPAAAALQALTPSLLVIVQHGHLVSAKPEIRRPWLHSSCPTIFQMLSRRPQMTWLTVLWRHAKLVRNVWGIGY